MRITVKGYVSMQKYTSCLPSDGSIDVPSEVTAGNVLTRLEIPADIRKWVRVFINGRFSELNDALHEGDSLVFFPPLEGG